MGPSVVNGEKGCSGIEPLARWDGQHYTDILEKGYCQRLTVFFPVYSCVGACVAATFNVDAIVALLAVSNASYFGAFWLMTTYLQERQASCANSNQSRNANRYALIIMGVLPTTFFFRMAYSESLFLILSILAIYAMERRWSLLVIAIIVGLATAARPVGISLLIPFIWHVYANSQSRTDACRKLSYTLPISCWGLAIYMAYLYWQFGEPFAYATEQEKWRIRPLDSFEEKLLSLAALEPIWSVYLHGWPGYLEASQGHRLLTFANPVYFVGTALLIITGIYKRWLTPYEWLLAVPLVGIPYLTRAHEMSMVSQGRFTGVIFPVYIVVGQLLARLPKFLSAMLLLISGSLMLIYATLFGAGKALF